jgi:hypothetical protein
MALTVDSAGQTVFRPLTAMTSPGTPARFAPTGTPTPAVQTPPRETPPRQRLADDPDGVIKHEVAPGENLTTIARLYADTREEADRLVWSIVATDPQFVLDGQDPHGLRIGQTITIYDPVRAQAARDMLTVAETGGPAGVKAIAYTEILYATRNEATPAGMLDDILADLKARRPGDAAFAAAIDQAGAEAAEYWHGVGRSRDVFDPLNAAAERGDWAEVERIALGQLETLAQTKPSVAAIEAHRDMLLRYGPQAAGFQTAVRDAAHSYLVERPQQAADRVRLAYEQAEEPNDAARLAAAELRAVTDPDQVDGLTAALILEKADATIDDILSDFLNPGMGLWYDKPGTGIVGSYGEIYRDLSAAGDSAHRSPDGRDSFHSIAALLSNKPGIETMTERAVTESGGTLLSFQIASDLVERGDFETAREVVAATLRGHEAIEGAVRDPVTTFGNHSFLVTQPGENFAPFLTGDQVTQANEGWVRQPPDFVTRLDQDLAAIDPVGYNYLRSLTGIGQYQEELRDYGLDGAFEAQTTQLAEDQQLQFAITATESPVVESVRLFNEEYTANGQVFDPLLLQPQVDEALAALENGPSPAARAAVFATLGLGPGFLVLSQVKFGRAADMRVAGLLPEQWLRDMVMRTAAGGQYLENPFADWAAKAAVNDLVVLSSSTLYNRTFGRANPDLYRIPGQAIAARLAMGPLVSAGEAGIRALEEGGILPTPPTGPDGRPQYDTIFDWMAYKTPRAVNLMIGVGGPLAAASAWRGGSERVYNLPPGQTASFRQAIRDGNLGRIFREGLPDAIRTGRLSVSVLAAQYLISEALFDQTGPAGMPPLDNPLQDGPVGKISLGATLVGPVVPLVSSAAWAGPVGWALIGVGTAGLLVSMGVDRARMANQLEGPTREYLTAAGLRPEIANELANHDSEGRPVVLQLATLAERAGLEPTELMARLNRMDPDEVGDIVVAMHYMERNDAGELMIDRPLDLRFMARAPHMTDEEAQDIFLNQPEFVDQYFGDRSMIRPTSVVGMEQWLDRYFPELLAS